MRHAGHRRLCHMASGGRSAQDGEANQCNDGGRTVYKRSLPALVVKPMRPGIHEAVETMRHIAFDASAFLAMVLQSDAFVDGTVPVTLNQSFFSRIQHSVSVLDSSLPGTAPACAVSGFEHVHAHWLQLRGRDPRPFPSRSHIHRIIEYQSRKMLANFKALYGTHTYPRTASFLRHSLPALPKDTPLTTVVSFLNREAWAVEHMAQCRFSDWAQLPLDADVVERCRGLVADMRSRLDVARAGGLAAMARFHTWLLRHRPDGMKAFNAFPQRRRFGSTFIHLDMHAIEEIAPPELKQCMSAARRATLTPEHRAQCAVARAAHKVAVDLWKAADHEEGQPAETRDQRCQRALGPPPPPANDAAKPAVWGLVLRGGVPKDFAWSIDTDGRQVSVQCLRSEVAGRRRSEVAGRRRPRSTPSTEPRIPEAAAYVGVDPGRRDVFTNVSRTVACGGNEQDEKVWRMSGRRYRAELGTGRSERVNAQRVAAAGVQQLISDIPSRKEDVVPALMYIYSPQCAPLWKTFGSEACRRERFNAFRRKQRGAHRVFKAFVGDIDVENTVVLFGNANFGRARIRGHAPVAAGAGLRTLLQRCARSRHVPLKMVCVGEYNTSKLCSRCGCALNETRGHVHKINKETKKLETKKGAELWALRRCKNEDCGAMFWNRDTNAARNILYWNAPPFSSGRVPSNVGASRGHACRPPDDAPTAGGGQHPHKRARAPPASRFPGAEDC